MSYRPTDSSQTPTTMSTGLETSFITERVSDLVQSIEFNFSVRGFTAGGGPGEIASVLVSTLTRLREKGFLVVYVVITCTLSSHTQLW